MKARFLVSAFVILASSPSAHAAPEPRDAELATARQRFDAGRARVRAGRCDLAVEDFRASAEAAPNVGAWLNLGECLEALGRAQEAYEALRAAQALAADKRDDRLSVARASAERIQARMLTLVVSAPAGVRDVSLTVDDVVVPRERWSTILVSANDRHSFVARAPSAPPFTREVIGRAGDVMPIPIVFGSESREPAVERPPPSAAASNRTSTWRTAGIATAGIGAGALVGAGIFGILALSARGALGDAIANNSSCVGKYPNETCDVSTRDALDPLHSSADGRATAATVLFVAGITLVAGGLAMVFLGPREESKTARALRPTFVW